MGTADRLSMLCLLLLLAVSTPLSLADHERIDDGGDSNWLPADATSSTLHHRGGRAFNTCGCARLTASDRIVGGNGVSPRYSLPYQVYIVGNFTIGYACGGTVINRRYVLTAAHCLYDRYHKKLPTSGARVVVGEHDVCGPTGWPEMAAWSNEGGQVIKVERFIEQPDYRLGNDRHDIAILQLETDIKFGAHVKPACLPTNPNYSYAGKTAIASGWGSTIFHEWGTQQEFGTSCKLKQTRLKILRRFDQGCSDITDNDAETRMCAFKKGTDACHGDSGGPLAVVEGRKYVVVGVISNGKGCADQRYPGIYARVTNYLDWIVDNTQDGNC